MYHRLSPLTMRTIMFNIFQFLYYKFLNFKFIGLINFNIGYPICKY